MPFEEVHHTADWSIRVWAEDMPALFVEAARAVNALSGARLKTGQRTARRFTATADDPETLLVSFLSELVYAAEQEGVAFDTFSLSIDGRTLAADMTGAPLQSIEKNIKAVTYHQLHIRPQKSGFSVEIVFDV